MKRFLTRILIILALVVLSFGMLPAGSVQAATFDNDVEWNGIGHLPGSDICSNDGYPYRWPYPTSPAHNVVIRARAYMDDLTSVDVWYTTNASASTSGEWTRVGAGWLPIFGGCGGLGNMFVWSANIPIQPSQVWYKIALTDGTDTDWILWAGEGSGTVSDGDGGWTVASTSLTYTFPTVVWVDDGYTSGGANDGHTWGYDAFATIQTGVDGVAVGGTVNVLAGSYTEDVAVGKALTLQGVNDPAGASAAVVNGSIAVSASSSIRMLKIVGDGSTTGVNVTSGTVTLTNNIISDHYNGVLINGAGASAIIGGSTWAEGNLITESYYSVNISSGNAVVKGNVLSNIFRVFNQTGGTLNAYANNISGFSRARSGTGGTTLLRHNWWGSNDPLQTMPTGLTAADWQARLGARVNGWAEESDGSLTLQGATLSGAGSLQIVWHGDGAAIPNRPFGNGIEPYASRMCSDFYDLFAVGGSSTYTVSIPVDNTTGCNTYARDTKALYWIPAGTDYAAECSGADNKLCWDGVVVTKTVNIAGQNLTTAGLTWAELGGTQFVVGDIYGLDPTAIRLIDFQARSAGLPASLPLISLLGVALLFGAGFYLKRRI